LDSRIENGIINFETALSVLGDACIVNTPDYWREIAKSIDYTDLLLINMANKSRIVLEKIIHAEARGEPLEGQELVGNVVLNRDKDKRFPNGIHNVVFAANQFEPTRNGAYSAAVPSKSVINAVDSVLDGKDNSQGAIAFCTKAAAKIPGNWHERALTFLFEIGNHRFYK
jgi:N-acetylmuramoyl-L-alanine amidase